MASAGLRATSTLERPLERGGAYRREATHVKRHIRPLRGTLVAAII